MKFELNEKESRRAKKFIKKQRKKNPDEMTSIGGRFRYQFTPTGEGTGIVIEDCLLEKEKNITDYSCW